MSDHTERACIKCGSLLHHEDDCRGELNSNSFAQEIAAEYADLLHRPHISEDALRDGILSAITAAVAQAKEDDTARLDWLEEHDYDWRELEFSDQGLRFAIDSARNSGALELKEPSSESNLSTLVRAEAIKVMQAMPETAYRHLIEDKGNPEILPNLLQAAVDDFLSEHSNAAGAAQVSEIIKNMPQCNYCGDTGWLHDERCWYCKVEPLIDRRR